MRAKFTTLIDECRRMVASHLSPLFSNLFENADVVLLEFAEKAESNVAQQRFFEAMKEIQVKRPMLEQVFMEELAESFRRFRNFSFGGVSTEGISVMEGDENFSLVEKESWARTRSRVGRASWVNATVPRLASLRWSPGSRSWSSCCSTSS
jgi:hypothetical protein